MCVHCACVCVCVWVCVCLCVHVCLWRGTDASLTRWHSVEQIAEIPPIPFRAERPLAAIDLLTLWPAFPPQPSPLPPCLLCRPTTWNSRCFRPTVDLPLLWPGLQAFDIAQGAHQVPPWEERRELCLPPVQLHVCLPHSAWAAYGHAQARQRSGENHMAYIFPFFLHFLSCRSLARVLTHSLTHS